MSWSASRSRTKPRLPLLNAGFVAIKVDREERPDLDALYMDAVQAMTGQGGWPMSVLLTPDGRPFYGGTYFPDQPRHGLPSFRQVLAGVHDAWTNRRDEVEANASQLAEAIARGQQAPSLTLAPGTAGSGHENPGGATREPDRPRSGGSERAGYRKRGPAGVVRLCERAAGEAPPSSRSRWPSSCFFGVPAFRRRRGLRGGAAARSMRWPAAASTISSAAASRATRPTACGWCRTSRRCSTTTRSSPASTCTRGR